MKMGKVYLIGAGPGDYKLMTLKGLEHIRDAEVLVYDRLVSPRHLKEVPVDCELVYVGKASSNHTLPQEEINEILVKWAKMGKKVVRLKGGDPYVFGRGGEEGEFLVSHGIEVEVIPGITSAIGGLTFAGIPITHRRYASSFHVISAHLKNGLRELDWHSLAKLNGTLVFLMGARSLNEISSGLIKAKKPKATPVALIYSATMPRQHVDITTLAEMVRMEVKSPVLIVIGDVVNLRDKLSFFENKPLFGKNIVVTRARAQSTPLVDRLADLGANVIEVPTIKVVPLPDQQILKAELMQLANYQYLIFTSVNTVKIFFKVLAELGKDSRSLAPVKIVVIGKQTGKCLEEYGIKADFMPKLATLEGMVETLKSVLKSTDRILLPKAKMARTVLTDMLAGLFTEINLYETRIDTSSKNEILESLNNETIDYITFSSSSTVHNFVRLIGDEHFDKLHQAKLISLGPITSQAIKEVGLGVYKETKEPFIDAMVELLKESK